MNHNRKQTRGGDCRLDQYQIPFQQWETFITYAFYHSSSSIPIPYMYIYTPPPPFLGYDRMLSPPLAPAPPENLHSVRNYP